jgi:toxin CptA
MWAQLGTGLLVALSLIHGIRLYVARNAPQAITSALWDEMGIWTLTLASGENLTARLLPDSFVTVPLIVLNFKTDFHWRSRSLILSSDTVDSGLLRKLRVRLKLEYGTEKNDGLHTP